MKMEAASSCETLAIIYLFYPEKGSNKRLIWNWLSIYHSSAMKMEACGSPETLEMIYLLYPEEGNSTRFIWKVVNYLPLFLHEDGSNRFLRNFVSYLPLSCYDVGDRWFFQNVGNGILIVPWRTRPVHPKRTLLSTILLPWRWRL
jgi:hypothetical protein